MRSFIVNAAGAALLLSASISGVYAAGVASSDDGRQPPSFLDGQPPSGAINSPVTVDRMPTASITKHMAQPKHTTMRSDEHYRPRLARIVSELGAANHRIAADHKRGLLTAMEQRKVRSESAAIRLSAMKAAEMNRGTLSQGKYAMYQARIQDLNHMIHRLSTNTART